MFRILSITSIICLLSHAETWVKPSQLDYSRHSQDSFLDSSRVTFAEAQSICGSLGARIPTIKEFKILAKKCGGEKRMSKNSVAPTEEYVECIEKKGIYVSGGIYYWSLSTNGYGQTGFSFAGGGAIKNIDKEDGHYTHCIK